VIDSKTRNTYIVSAIVLLALVIGVYYPILCWLVNTWYNSQDYIYGFLVPVFSAWLLWDRRDMLKLDQLKGSYWGVLLVSAGVAASMYANYRFNHVLEVWSIVPLVGGLMLLIGGWHAIQWSWPAIVFLFFMAPLPQVLGEMLGQELQKIGTGISVFVLQTLGMPAVAEGNVIALSNSRLGVVEACSGLRMLMLFFAASFGAALYVRRDPLIRILIAISAPPIAIIANVARITVTAILYENVSQELGDKIFHDLAGWLMMPMAIAILWFETALLDHLFVAPERETPIALGTAAVDSAQRSEGRTRLPGDRPARQD